MLKSFHILNSTNWWIYSETPTTFFAFSLHEYFGNSYNVLSEFAVSSSHVSDQRITLNVKPKEEWNNLKFSKFLLYFLY